ncbi:unnamed protein product [Clavelina lepadiformis]|uniref:Heparan-alpha-glucosaminide N-acetyltransferase catalytic domain-containing protein n=1 Tax=Clavelina lepadiformis TaxID=159417 RepID=A0ABP0GKV9_CLALP
MFTINMKALHWIIICGATVIVKIPQFKAGESDVLANSYQSSGDAEVSKPLNKNMEFSDDLRFKIDTAKLTITKSNLAVDTAMDILLLLDNCYKCAYYKVETIQPSEKSVKILVDTRWPLTINLYAHKPNCSIKFHYFYGERGEYSVNFTTFLNGSCQYTGPKTDVHPWNSNLPILVAFLILLCMAMFYAIGKWIYSKKDVSSMSALISNDLGETDTANPSSSPTTQLSASTPRRERLKSIDTFRGLCIVIMIFVNFKGGHYWFFRHSTWNGLTVADLVFPWFMFIMGVNITLSVESLLKKNIPKGSIAYKIFRRTLILFALGITVINHNTSWETFRVPGVLQRFSIAYLFGFLIQWAFHKSAEELNSTEGDQTPWWFGVRDVVMYWPQWIIALGLEALWLLLTFLLPVPGCPTGYIGPGGLAEDGNYINETCIGGAAGYIDRWLFGEAHIYGHPTAKVIYYPMAGNDQRVPYDPEGVLGSINGCLIVFLGSQMGKIFLYYKTPKERTIRWLSWSVIFGVISIILCKASANEGWIPVNKNLWTTTFVTTLSCFAFFLVTIIYYLVDVFKIWSGSPLDFVGMNSILLYVGHEVLHGCIPFAWGATEYSTHAEYLAMNVIGVGCWVLIAYYCSYIKFFVKI